MLEFEPKGKDILEPLKQLQFDIVGYSSNVATLPFTMPMVLPFGEVSSRPSGVLALNLNIDNHVYSGGGEGATLSSPLFTDDFGGVIGNSVSELVSGMADAQFSFASAVSYIREYVFPDGKRYPTARMTVEMALIDAVAKSRGLNISEILGVDGKSREVPFGKSISGRTTDETLVEVEKAVGDNAKKIKLKISPSTSPDVFNALDEIRRRHGNLELMVDANGTYDPSNPNHIDTLKELDQKGLIMIEEPVSRVGDVRGLDAVRLLKDQIPVFNTSICLDDCLIDRQTTMQALNEDLSDIINIKPGRIGSIVSAIDLAYLCKKMGKQIMVGGMFEATPGRIMTTTLAGFFNSLGFRIPGDLSLAQDRLSEDIVPIDQQLKIGSNGGIILPIGLGWGFDLSERYGVVK